MVVGCFEVCKQKQFRRKGRLRDNEKGFGDRYTNRATVRANQETEEWMC